MTKSSVALACIIASTFSSKDINRNEKLVHVCMHGRPQTGMQTIMECMGGVGLYYDVIVIILF